MAFQRKKSAAVGIKAPFPGFLEPELATAVEEMPSGERWLHEIKFDGYRVQVHLVNEAVKVFTRRGNDWTKRFRKIADDAWHIGSLTCLSVASSSLVAVTRNKRALAQELSPSGLRSPRGRCHSTQDHRSARRIHTVSDSRVGEPVCGLRAKRLQIPDREKSAILKEPTVSKAR